MQNNNTTHIRNMKPLGSIACITLCLLASCASNPQARIEKAPELFKNYSAHEQYLIRQGRIEIGFDPEQVRLAWGDPQKSRKETTPKGTRMVWEYTRLRPNLGAYSGATIDRGFNAGVRMKGSPTQTKLIGRVFFDPRTGEVERFQEFK